MVQYLSHIEAHTHPHNNVDHLLGCRCWGCGCGPGPWGWTPTAGSLIALDLNTFGSLGTFCVSWAKTQAGACPLFWWSWSRLASGGCCYQVTLFFPSVDSCLDSLENVGPENSNIAALQGDQWTLGSLVAGKAGSQLPLRHWTGLICFGGGRKVIDDHFINLPWDFLFPFWIL